MKKLFSFRNTKLQHFGRDLKEDQNLILRDYLSIERTRLSNERTLLSYIRTFLYLIVGGIALIQLDDLYNLKYLGILALTLSVVFLIIGIFRFFLLKKNLKHFYYKSQERPNPH
ncbi:DUF202 domain-containing protein [Sinomicrobium sp.]